jgi:hypothetical protein
MRGVARVADRKSADWIGAESADSPSLLTCHPTTRRQSMSAPSEGGAIRVAEPGSALLSWNDIRLVVSHMVSFSSASLSIPQTGQSRRCLSRTHGAEAGGNLIFHTARKSVLVQVCQPAPPGKKRTSRHTCHQQRDALQAADVDQLVDLFEQAARDCESWAVTRVGLVTDMKKEN